MFQQRKEVKVYDATMSYVETDSESKHTVIFLHGNPTSSFLWRNIIPHVSSIARCLAPDLVGMGKSSKINGILYTFDDHYKYFEKWMNSVNLPKKVNVVCHDWGSGLAFRWASLNPNKIESITHMESLVGPIPWDAFPDDAKQLFRDLRSPAGEEMTLKNNLFVEEVLRNTIIRSLTDEEFATYLEPYKNAGEDRRPTLTWPRELPIKHDGPENVLKYSEGWNRFLSNSKSLPKLYIHGEPGFFSSTLLEVTKDWPNQQVAKVKGVHFLQEDSPHDIGKAIYDFLSTRVFK